MPTRQLVEDNGIIRRYRVLNDAGQEVGTDTETIPTPAQVNGTAIRGRIAAQLAPSVAYLALAAPTAAQTTAQVQRNTRLVIALGKLALGQLDTTDGT
jgi:hypothetical protein